MKIIYMGTPDFAQKPLEAIYNSNHQVVAVVTQNDKLGNRNKLTSPPVKQLAERLGIEVYQYDKISREGVEDMRALNADIIVTCAFGQILSQEILDICPKGVINIHASLLPKYRGSSPIQWSIINGDKLTGVTIMQTAKSVDSGDIIEMTSLEIGDNETAGELFERLSILGADTIVNVLDNIENSSATFTPQDHSKASHCKMLVKADGLINFNMLPDQIDYLVRGMSPWPSAYFMLGGQVIKVFKVKKIGSNSNCLNLDCSKIGAILSSDLEKGFVIACLGGAVEILEMQVSGGKRMPPKDYLRGHKILNSSVDGSTNE